MYRLGLVLFLGFLCSCHDEKKPAAGKGAAGFDYAAFSAQFRAATLPYSLSDSSLKRMVDTVKLSSADMTAFFPDSLKQKLFGKTAGLSYQPLARLAAGNTETYYIVKASGQGKAVALLLCFLKDKGYAATFPFLVPDTDPSTFQNSSIDKTGNISVGAQRRKGSELLGEGKDVYVYNAAANSFTLIMTDALDEKGGELINPIDTLPRTGRFSGDYVKGKRSLISIRDARVPSQAMAFVHLEKEDGDCSGELKGVILFTSSTTAIYRQGGDPCVLQFRFTPNGVTLREEEGCGNHRGLDCAFEGSFTRKKAARSKPVEKKGTKK